jgi:hypothetical protein
MLMARYFGQRDSFCVLPDFPALTSQKREEERASRYAHLLQSCFCPPVYEESCFFLFGTLPTFATTLETTT